MPHAHIIATIAGLASNYWFVATCSAIACGECNFIDLGAANVVTGSGIFAGQCNSIVTAGADVLNSVVGGGYCNIICASNSVIGGGYKNVMSSSSSVIAGGYCNNVSGSANSGILGGYCNIVAGGYSSVTGGCCNSVSASYSSVTGGYCNISTGNWSAILGGQNNSDGGNDLVGIFGNGITATALPGGVSALWANNVIVPNIPLAVGGAPPPAYPPGTLYYIPDPITGNCAVYVV